MAEGCFVFRQDFGFAFPVACQRTPNHLGRNYFSCLDLFDFEPLPRPTNGQPRMIHDSGGEAGEEKMLQWSSPIGPDFMQVGFPNGTKGKVLDR